MRLRDLEARFRRREVRIEPTRRVKAEFLDAQGLPTRRPITDDMIEERIGPVVYLPHVDTLAEADGVMFLCPKCYQEPPVGPVGCHSVICWFVGKVPDDADPKPGRWNPSGTGLDDLTFIGPGAASVLLTGGGCGAHFFVRKGGIEF